MISLYSRRAITNKTATKQEIPTVKNAGKYVNMQSWVFPAANAAAAEPIQSHRVRPAFMINSVLLI